MGRSLSRRALWMQKLAGEVARGLTARIAAGEIAPGAPLAEREALAADFVTSTGVVDRALEMLSAAGLVRHGPDGRYHAATEHPPDHGFELSADIGETSADVVAILELRMGVELVSAALAAERRSAGDLDRIRAARDAVAAAARRGSGIAQADVAFHLAIATASGNPYILDLIDYLGPLLVPRMRLALPLDDGPRDRNLAASRAEHDRIVAAIEAGDADAARIAMREHLARTIDMVRAIG